MPRRALRKLDPSLDLSGHLVTFEQLPAPWNTASLFGRDAPLEVEIGSGKGLFLSAAAAADPGTNFLGVELARKYAHYAASRIARLQLPNARLLHGDAVRLLRELPDSSVVAVHVYFPDPWWKARHKKRRVMNEMLLKDVERTLTPGGTLHFWTDVQEYFETSLELIAKFTALAGPFPVAVKPADHDLDYRTHFERRMRLAGEAVYRAEFRKVGEFRVEQR